MKKYLCLLLALFMVIACFAACTPEENVDNSSVSKDDNSTSSSTVYQDMLPEATNMGGRIFNIYQRWFGYGKETIDFQGEVIWEDSEDGTMSNINRAKREVLEAVQNAYNCQITGTISTDSAGEIRQYIQDDILSGKPTIDFCFETSYYYYSFVENDYLVDLKSLGIDFSKPWWDQNAVKDLSVCNKLYYALGDINTYDNDGTFVILFNKDLYEEKFGEGSYKELYKLAEEGKWTFDVLADKVKGFGYESSGDNVRDEFDTYGLLTETANLYHHVLAAGEKSLDKNADDEVEFALENERVYSSLNAAVDLYLNNNDVLVADLEKYVTKYDTAVYENTVTKAFKEGRGLFYMTGLIHLPYFRDMEDDFGILPVPRYDDTQDRYYHNMSAHTASCVFVPKGVLSTGEKGQQIGIILDALGAYSKDYLTPEYYDKQLKRGDASDPDSAAMLDIIFESRTFDLGAVFGKVFSDPIDMCNYLDKDLQSRISTNKDLIEIAIDDMMEQLKAE